MGVRRVLHESGAAAGLKTCSILSCKARVVDWGQSEMDAMSMNWAVEGRVFKQI
jgi:hypothetical protein